MCCFFETSRNIECTGARLLVGAVATEYFQGAVLLAGAVEAGAQQECRLLCGLLRVQPFRREHRILECVMIQGIPDGRLDRVHHHSAKLKKINKN